MFPSHIAKEDVRELPLIRFDGTIHLLDTDEKLQTAIKNLKNFEVLGFDTETKPTFNRGEYNSTALIQLSTIKDAYIIRVKELGIPNSLKILFEDDSVVKVGISIADDIKELKKIRPFKAASFLDLNDVAKELGIKQIGMKSLAGIFLKSRISKNQQTSNWENHQLTPSQLSYASTDAWVCAKIHQLLLSKGFID